MEIDDSQKVAILISVASRTYDETKRYRDHVWKMLVWTISLLVGVVAVAKSSPDLARSCYGKWLGGMFVLVVAAFGAWNIHFDYKQLVLNRNFLRRCERLLKLFDAGVYGSETVLLEKWKSADYEFKQCLPHYLQWMFVIIAMVAYVMHTIVTA